VRALEKALPGACGRLRRSALRGKSQTGGCNSGKVQELLGKPVFMDDPLMKRRKAGVSWAWPGPRLAAPPSTWKR